MVLLPAQSGSQSFCENHTWKWMAGCLHSAQWYIPLIHSKKIQLLLWLEESSIYQAEKCIQDNTQQTYEIPPMYIFCTFYYPGRALCPVSFYYCRLEYSYFQHVVLLYHRFFTWIYTHIKSPEIISKFSSLSSVLQLQNVTYFFSCLTVKELTA